MIAKPSGCAGCPWFSDGQGFVPDEIRPSAKLAVIAQNPGDTEEFMGKPLIGATGQMLMSDLNRYGIAREDASFLNVMKCRWLPPGAKKKSNEIPSEKDQGQLAQQAQAHCKRYLQESLRAIDPNLTMVLGEYALNAATGMREVASWQGSVWVPESGMCTGRKCIAMIHPAALYRDLSWRTAYKHAFPRVAREIGSKDLAIKYNDNFRLGVSAAEFIATLEGLGTQRVALDIETSKRKPIEAKLYIIGIAWSAEDAMNYLADENLDEVIEAISRFKGEWVTATQFDYSVLKNYGARFDWDRCHDLTLLHSRFDIELPHTVEFIASMTTNRPFWKWMSASDPLKYNALDCAGEWEAFETLYRYCGHSDRGVMAIYETDRRCLPVEVDLHLNGFPTDPKLIATEREWYVARRDAIQTELLAAFQPKQSSDPPPACESHPRYSGKTPVKLRKGETETCASCVAIHKHAVEARPLKLTQRKRLMKLMEADGMKMLKDKETGEDSLAKGKIADLYKKYGDPRLLRLLEFYEQDTVVSRYFKDAWITKATGRIHPTYSMHSAMHRWHCKDPNMQAIRKPQKVIETVDE